MLEGVDGRTTAARRFRDICRSYEQEAGGNVSEVERDLIRQAAGLTLRAEQLQADIVRGDKIDSDQLIRLTGTAKRILEAISEKASKRSAPAVAGQDFQTYVASKAADKAA